LFQERDFSKQARKPVQRAFLPELYGGHYETSIGRLSQAPQGRISHLGMHIRSPKQAIARAVIPASAVTAAGLTIHGVPKLCYAEHAVIKGWSEENDCKAAHKAAAAIMVKAAELELPIPDRK